MLFVSIRFLAGKVNLESQQYFFKLMSLKKEILLKERKNKSTCMYFYFYVLDQI